VCVLLREYFSGLAKTHTVAPQRSGTTATVTPLHGTRPSSGAAGVTEQLERVLSLRRLPGVELSGPNHVERCERCDSSYPENAHSQAELRRDARHVGSRVSAEQHQGLVCRCPDGEVLTNSECGVRSWPAHQETCMATLPECARTPQLAHGSGVKSPALSGSRKRQSNQHGPPHGCPAKEEITMMWWYRDGMSGWGYLRAVDREHGCVLGSAHCRRWRRVPVPEPHAG
jgi:hypothetical protein